MSYALCTVPAAPLRREPSHRSEMTSQLLFGEAVTITASQDEWRQVRSLSDNYEGWVTYHLIEETESPLISSMVTTGLLNPLRWREGLLHAPMGSFLPGLDGEGKLWDGHSQYDGLFRDVSLRDAGLLIPTALLWLNAPYLWGGKTLMGVDCSGFAQTVFRVAGIPLPRDAYQQAEVGTRVHTIAESRPGDLAFFHNEKGRITHVGLLLGNDEIIHASGRVRIDRLDEQGIFSRELGRHTHPLHSIGRMDD